MAMIPYTGLLLLCLLSCFSMSSSTKSTSTRSVENHVDVVSEENNENEGPVAVGDAIVAVIENRAAFFDVALSWLRAIVQGIFGHMGSELGHIMWGVLMGPERIKRSGDGSEADEEAWIIPWLEHKIKLDDLKLVERFILDTVDVIKSWQHRIRLLRQDEL